MAYQVQFDPNKAHARVRRGNVDITVQRHPTGRHVAFVGAECLGAASTRAEAVDAAYQAVLSRMLTGNVAAERERLTRSAHEAGQEIAATPEMRRIFNLPRFPCPDFPDYCAAAWSSPQSSARLRPFQVWALYHMAFMAAHYPGRGALISAGVGHGKTLVGLLAARVLGARRPLILAPAALLPQWRTDINRYRAEGFEFAAPELASHESLGAPTGASALDFVPSIDGSADGPPDLVVIDEAGAFANRKSTRTRRLVEWHRKTSPQPRLVAMSATLLRSSLMDVAELARMALGDLSPLPLHYPDLSALASAVDADPRGMGDGFRCRPGVLRSFAVGVDRDAPDLTVSRRAVRNILRERLGYVTVLDHHRAAGETAAPLTVRFLRADPPSSVTGALAKLDADWVHPTSGEAMTQALAYHRAAVELALGYATRWDPPPPAVWDEPRRTMARALHRVRRHGKLDSPGAWARALRAGKAPHATVNLGDELSPDLHTLADLWGAWVDAAAAHGTTDAVGATFPGSQRVVEWLSDYAIQAAVAWGRERPGLIWTRSPHVGEAVAAAGGWRYYGAGPLSADLGPQTPADQTAVVSIPVNHKGKNLQQYHRNLILQPTGSADVLEQLIGRTHRAGQREAVSVEVFAPTRHAEDAILAALRRSGFVDEVEGSAYKLWRQRSGLTFIHGEPDAELARALEEDGT